MTTELILEGQREFFASGATLPLKFRTEMLKKLHAHILMHENDLLAAMKEDLGKSDYEGYMCELGGVLSEISYLIKNLKKLARAKRVRTPLPQFVSKCYTLPRPFGNVLIMSPWNYPVLLALSPLADALAAGNTAIVKPSAYAPRTSDAIARLISECFPAEYVTAVTGGREENQSLLSSKFDFIFFTGSGNVGKEVLRHAAENLTPAVLELGGKSPCIVERSAKIPLAARRIVFGKYLNCGQTCVAPDYIICERAIKDELIDAISKEIRTQFGDDPLSDPDYGKIVNKKHFDRILSLIDREKTVVGGRACEEKLQIEPTVMSNVTFDDAVMGEEIFGPVLPIIDVESVEEIPDMLEDRDKPLALYIFTENKSIARRFTESIRFGGGCINDTVIHVSVGALPFGGVGESGMGRYHGAEGFKTFSHIKSILDKKTYIDLGTRYQPYNRKKNSKLLHKLLK